VLTARDRNFAGDSSLKVALIPLMGDVLELIETLGRKTYTPLECSEAV
jgi:hypothetical protein